MSDFDLVKRFRNQAVGLNTVQQSDSSSMVVNNTRIKGATNLVSKQTQVTRRKPHKTVEKKKYPVKVVYLVYPDDYNASGAAIDFYIGGDRPEPELIFQLPVKKNGEYINFYNGAKLTNTGNDLDNWILQLFYTYSERTPENYDITYCQIISPEYGNFLYSPESGGITSYMVNLGYGAFIDSVFGYSNYPYQYAPSGVLFSTHFTITKIKTTFNDTRASGAQNRVTLHQLEPIISTTIYSQTFPAFRYQERTIGTGEDIFFDDRRVIRNFFVGSSGTFPSSTIPSTDIRAEFPLFYINPVTGNTSQGIQFFDYKRRYVFGGGGTLAYPAITGNYFDSEGNIVGSYSYQTSLEYYGSKNYQAEREIPSLFGDSFQSNTNIIFPQTAPDGYFDNVGSRTSVNPNESSVILEKELLQGDVKPNYAFLGTNGSDTVILVKETEALERVNDNLWLAVTSREIVAWVTKNGAVTEKECPNTKITVYVSTDRKSNNNFVNYNRWIALFFQGKTVCVNNQIQVIGKPVNITGIYGKNPFVYSFNVWQDGVDYPVNIFKHEMCLDRLYIKAHTATSYSDLLGNPDIADNAVEYIQSLGVEGDYRNFPYNQGDLVFVNIYEWDEDFNLSRVDPPSDTVEYFSVNTGDDLFENGESYENLWSVYIES